MKHYFKNPRTITKKEFSDLRDSLRKFGDLGVIVHNLRTDEIISGNQRMEVFDLSKCKIDITEKFDPPTKTGTVAIGWLWWEDERFTYRAVDWDERQSEEANIRANKAGGQFDFDVLANLWELDDLIEWGFTEKELQLGGFDLDQPEGEDPGAQVDKAEELRVKWDVKTGDLWILGNHRLLCGDSTNSADVARLMGEDKADLLLNDPPYGMRLDADFSGMVNHLDFANEKGVKNGKKYADVIGDHEDYDASPVMALFSDVKEQFWWGADYYSATLGDTMHEGAWLIWDKRLDESADKMYGSCFEMLWSKQKHKRDILRHKWAGIFGTEKEPQRGRMHPNQKPVELYEDLLKRYSDAGALIVDCYSGSGTTLIACERLSRKCRAVEISPAYVSVALERFYVMTGILPELMDLK